MEDPPDEGFMELVLGDEGVVPGAASSTHSKPKKTGSERSAKTRADTPSGRSKEKIPLAVKFMAYLFGRICGLCGKTDRSPDLVEPARTKLWGYYRKCLKDCRGDIVPAGSYMTEGATCLNCLRVWNAVFIDEFSLSEYKRECASDHELNQTHVRFVHWLVQKTLEHMENGGDREDVLNLRWPSPIQLESLQIWETRWTMPEQQHLLQDDYQLQYGDWRTNARGDGPEVVGPNGEALLMLKMVMRWIKSRHQIDQAIKRRVMTDANDGIGGLVVEQRWKRLAGKTDKAAEKRAAKDRAISKGAAKKKAKKGADSESDEAVMKTPVKADGSDSFFDALGGAEDAFPSSCSKAERRPANNSPAEAASEECAGRGSAAKAMPVDAVGQRNKGANAKKKAKATAKAKDGKSGPGPRKKDRPELLRIGMSELKSAGRDSRKFFGAEWKTSTKRNWEEYLKDVSEQIEVETCSDTLQSLQELEKTVKVAKRVLHKVFTSGLTSESTVSLFFTELEFLNKPPKVSSPFPVYLTSTLHSEACSAAWPATVFWDKVLDTDLVISYKREAEVVDRQIELVSEKIMGLTAPSGNEEEAVDRCAGDMRELVSEFFKLRTDLSMVGELVKFVESLAVLALAPNYPPKASVQDRVKLLESTLDDLLVEGNILGMALFKFKTGEKFIQRCKSFKKNLEKFQATTSSLVGVWESAKTDVHKLKELEGFVGKVGPKIASKVILSSEVRTRRADLVFSVHLLLIASDSVDWKLPEVINIQDRLNVLIEAEQLHKLHGDSGDIQKYKALESFAKARKLADEIQDVSSISEADAKAIYFQFSSIKLESELYTIIKDEVGEEQADEMLKWASKQMSSQKVEQCMVTCSNSAQPFLAAVKQMVSDVFSNTAEVDLESSAFADKCSLSEFRVDDAVSPMSLLSRTIVCINISLVSHIRILP